jgi:hypothetical protein
MSPKKVKKIEVNEGEKTMAPETQTTNEVETTQLPAGFFAGKDGKPTLIITSKELKPKQEILDLASMANTNIQLFYKEFSVNPDAPQELVLAAVADLVSPDSERVKAFVRYANAQQYQEAKKKALAGGDYMSPQLRSALTGIMAGIEAFADRTAADNFTYWQEAYKDTANAVRQGKARKLLDRARMQLDNAEFEGM